MYRDKRLWHDALRLAEDWNLPNKAAEIQAELAGSRCQQKRARCVCACVCVCMSVGMCACMCVLVFLCVRLCVLVCGSHTSMTSQFHVSEPVQCISCRSVCVHYLTDKHYACAQTHIHMH
jgi:hypothetical protein